MSFKFVLPSLPDRGLWLSLAWGVLSVALPINGAPGTDYFLTIGGGYEPSGNQASLEANVLFFQDVLQEKHTGGRTQATFFADGSDPQADLQVLSKAIAANTSDEDNFAESVTSLLVKLNSFRGNQGQPVEYRNHRIPNVSGANSPSSIHASLTHMCSSMTAGDRLIVYVTAHGSEAEGRNKFNTSISCWDEQAITAREFESWLDEVPATVPVVMIMAQCYCGGFAHTIFQAADRQQGLAKQPRVGFFAQQHDLPAAGCRPDIENDEEYSSFFWGAMVGRSRTGKKMTSADFDGDGRVSFAEAHAHAMLTSQTIDIPLRSSEALLRTYSAIGGGYDHRRSDDVDLPVTGLSDSQLETVDLAPMSGTVREISKGSALEWQHTVAGLLKQLELKPDDNITSIFTSFEEQRSISSNLRRQSSRNRRGGSGRRELRAEIVEKWPELGERQWRSAEILRDSEHSELLAAIKQLPSYARYVENQRAREKNSAAMDQAELREVKFQRLINTLEAIVLDKNLSLLADSEVIEHYQRMITLEQSTLAQK